MKFPFALLLGASLLFHCLPAPADALRAAYGSPEDEGETQGYDSIVNELNREAERPVHVRARVHPANDPLDTVWFHFGVGGSTMTETLSLDDGSQYYLGLKGLQISGGIDLFSQNWMAEGTLRNFGQGSEQPTQLSLQEFELKIIYRDRLTRQLGFHVGGGLSARYLSIERPGKGALNYTTPTSLATGGFDVFISDRLSVGLEASARDSLVAETIDHNSIDATLRLDLQL